MTPRHLLHRMLTIVFTIALTAGSTFARDVIDRVMAVVNGSVITQSEVSGLVRLGIEKPADGNTETLLNRLIDRRLILTEVNRYSPPEPAAGLVDVRLAEIRQRFPDEEAFNAVLAESGITPEALRAYVRDDLRIAAYLRQRFGAAYQPSDADILQYYRTHAPEFTRDGVLLGYSEAHDDARAAVIAERREALSRDWINGLRRRAEITIPAIVRR